MTLRAAFTLTCLCAAALFAGAQDELRPGVTVVQVNDTLRLLVPDSTITHPQSKTLWIRQLLNNRFNINDPEIDYPRFPRFCRNVYNWGDHVFNTYNTDYVVGTGKNWKLQAKSYNWLQTYSFIFDAQHSVNVRSDLYADMGAYLSFMAVSVGYMWNVNEWMGHGNGNRSNFNFNFTCALFTLDFMAQTSDGGGRIFRYKTPETGTQHTPLDLNSLRNSSRYFTAYYFFNHSKYSHAAAYSFSKYQLRSAGSWLAGFTWTHQDLDIDFSDLVNQHKANGHTMLNVPTAFNFNYTDYTVLGGYGYNWALRPRVWLFNVTALAGLGYKRHSEEVLNNGVTALAIDGKLQFSLVYNHRALFCALQGNIFGSLFVSRDYTFFNTTAYLQFLVGMRF